MPVDLLLPLKRSCKSPQQWSLLAREPPSPTCHRSSCLARQWRRRQQRAPLSPAGVGMVEDCRVLPLGTLGQAGEREMGMVGENGLVLGKESPPASLCCTLYPPTDEIALSCSMLAKGPGAKGRLRGSPGPPLSFC